MYLKTLNKAELAVLRPHFRFAHTLNGEPLMLLWGFLLPWSAVWMWAHSQVGILLGDKTEERDTRT